MTPPKPHRTLRERVSSYADEAAAYLRRRRQLRQPFARVHYSGGRSVALERDSDAGARLFAAAEALVALAPRPVRGRR